MENNTPHEPIRTSNHRNPMAFNKSAYWIHFKAHRWNKKIYCKANKHFKWTVNAELHWVLSVISVYRPIVQQAKAPFKWRFLFYREVAAISATYPNLNGTSFPENIDSFPKKTEPGIEDLTKIEQYHGPSMLRMTWQELMQFSLLILNLKQCSSMLRH